MTNKNNSIVLSVAMIMMIALMTGCKSPGLNPAGVYGSDLSGNGMDLGMDYNSSGTIPMGGRFTGGTEYPGMFESVLFSFDSSQVPADQRAKIETVANYLKQNPAKAVIIEGNCDERGSREYNVALGEQRAQSVRAYLISLGISSDRIQTKSYGEERPVSMGHDESAWNLNRRGEFVLYY